jgi:hypothetical protein
MGHAFRVCVILLGTALALEDRAFAQCFVCSDKNENTAVGTEALNSGVTAGNGNNALGFRALFSNTSGGYNTAFGYNALYSNTTGSHNNAAGYATLLANTTGSYNNAMGIEALYANTLGSQNSAVGYGALYNNTTGNYNTAMGYFAGFNLTSGNNNIDINNRGMSGESGVIRIGIQGTQGSTYIAGIYGSTVTSGVSVIVDATGHLGIASSSRAYKQDIEPVHDQSERLYRLRPVTFRYTQADIRGEKPLQYGLIAEEVATVFPELVSYNTNGKPETVAYQTLTPLLLDQLQKQHRELRETQALLRTQTRELAALKAQLAGLTQAHGQSAAGATHVGAPPDSATLIAQVGNER